MSKFERFTEHTQEVLSLAYQEAERVSHARVSTLDLLAGLLREENGVAGGVLRSMGLIWEKLELSVKPTLGDDSETPTLSQELEAVLQQAINEANRLGHDAIGTEHLLYGLMRHKKGKGYRVLLDHGITEDSVGKQGLRLVAGPPPRRSGLPRPKRSAVMADCPRDHSPLSSRFISGVQAYHCDTCDGLLIRKESLKRLYGLTAAPVPSVFATTKASPSRHEDSSLVCPDDDTRMVVIDYRQAEIDVCPDCECVWLDESELERIWARYEEGAGPDVRPRPQDSAPPTPRELIKLMRAVIEFVEGTILDFVEALMDWRRG